MSAIIMGLNQFKDCRTLIAWQDHPILRAEDDLASLQLDTTGLGEKIHGIRIEGQQIMHGDSVRIVASDKGTTVFLDDEAILFVTQREDGTIHIKLDLRPLGLNIFDDVAGLHVGSNIMANNLFNQCQVGIRLA